MRTTRLLAIMMELSRGQRTTVRRLADRHGISTRTVLRDLAALHEIGVPVWTRTGPAGGVGLVDGWSSPVTGMTASELQALLIGEAGSRDLGLGDDFDTARLKMLGTTTARDPAVGSATERFLIDHERWFAEPERPNALPMVSRAVWSGRRLTIGYHRGTGAPVTRLLDPLGLVLKTDVWYLVAAHRRRTRTYRLSRIASAEIHGEPAWRPEGFSLAEYWGRSRTDFEQSVQRLPVRLSLPQTSATALLEAVPGPGTATALVSARRQSGGQSSGQGGGQGERLEVELLMEDREIAVGQLLHVPDVEVNEPRDLRTRLCERAQQLAARNAPPT